MNDILAGGAAVPRAYTLPGITPARFGPLSPNPLCRSTAEVRPWQTYEEWRAAMQAAASMGDWLTCLHYGFSIDCPDQGRRVERIRIYMAVANGWMCEDNFRINDGDSSTFAFEGSTRKTRAQLRHHIARKAHAMLCLNPFCKDYLAIGRGDIDAHVQNLCHFGYLQALMTFYCPYPCESTGYGKIRNLPRNTSGPGERDHNEKVRVLILGLASSLFQYPLRKNCGVSNVVKVARLWMIEVLSYLDKLHVLDREAETLSEDEALKMREIATRTRIDGVQVTDLRVLFASGNKAAVFYNRWFIAKELRKPGKR